VRLPQAALALLCAAVAPGCVNEDKPVQVDARELAAAGFAAVGADSVGVRVTAERREGVVHVHASKPRGEGLLTVLPMFERVHARIEAFCPPPGILRCTPALRASGAIRDGRAPRHLAEALRKLAARSYGDGPMVRRRGAAIRILSPYGELLAGVRTRGRVVLMSFGGGPVAARPARATAGRLVLVAGPDALGALRAALPAPARTALERARRLAVMMPLPR
jgi:hypothetical protein